MLNDREARQVIEEYAERVADLSGLVESQTIDFNASLFDIQRDIINSPSKKKACIAGRRAGKSITAAYYLIKTAYENPRVKVAYIALSRKSAKEIIWDEILDIMDRYKINYHEHKVDLTLTLDNGSKVSVHGASAKRELEKHRGIKYELVVVDECASPQFLPMMDSIVDDIIGPTLMDTDGTIMLISTPGIVTTGLFYDITKKGKKGWDTWTWNMTHNPKLPRWADIKDYRPLAESLLAEIREDKGWTVDSSVYKREYLGQWVESDDALIYPYSDNNRYKNLPNMSFQYIFGVDLGVVDASTIIVGAYSPETPNLYIVDEFKQTEMAPSDFAKVLKRYSDKYQPTSIIADQNGLGKAFVAEIEKRFVLPIEAAEKINKIGMIELMADDFRLGKIKLHNGLVELNKELYSYLWKDKRLKILPDGDEHLLDALLYMWRRSLHFIGTIQAAKGQPNEEQLMFEEALDEANNNKEWWDI